MVGGMVLLAAGAAAHGAYKLTQKDADQIEQHTGQSVEDMSEEDLVAAMEELGIQSIELTDDDKAVIAREEDTPGDAAPPASASTTDTDRITLAQLIIFFLLFRAVDTVSKKQKRRIPGERERARLLTRAGYSP